MKVYLVGGPKDGEVIDHDPHPISGEFINIAIPDKVTSWAPENPWAWEQCIKTKTHTYKITKFKCPSGKQFMVALHSDELTPQVPEWMIGIDPAMKNDEWKFNYMGAPWEPTLKNTDLEPLKIKPYYGGQPIKFGTIKPLAFQAKVEPCTPEAEGKTLAQLYAEMIDQEIMAATETSVGKELSDKDPNGCNG